MNLYAKAFTFNIDLNFNELHFLRNFGGEEKVAQYHQKMASRK
jgi:hypothetical protein